MTDRHPFDCFITPPCAAIALGVWHGLRPRFRTALDPFAGPGTLVPWTGLAERAHAREIDPRWESEARANAATVHIGDSLSEAWLINGRVPHIITNPPYKLTRETIERARDHAYEHRRCADGSDERALVGSPRSPTRATSGAQAPLAARLSHGPSGPRSMSHGPS